MIVDACGTLVLELLSTTQYTIAEKKMCRSVYKRIFVFRYINKFSSSNNLSYSLPVYFSDPLLVGLIMFWLQETDILQCDQEHLGTNRKEAILRRYNEKRKRSHSNER